MAEVVLPSADTGDEGRFRAQYYCVALLDLLSQRERLAQWAVLPEGPNAKQTLLQSLHGSLLHVKEFRDFASSFTDSFRSERVPTEHLALLPEADRANFKEMGKSEMGLQMFSDTVVWHSPMRFVNDEPRLKDVLGMLGSAAALFLIGLTRGFVIRGAIEIGAGVDAFAGEVYGPCLAVAHHLESECAEYPRILVGPNLAGAIRELVSRHSTAPNFSSLIATESLANLVTQDDDGQVIVDWLGPYMHAMKANGSGSFAALVPKAVEFIEAERGRFHRESNDKLAGRYDRLAAYVKRRADQWNLQL